MPVMTLFSKNIWLIPLRSISAKFLIDINLYRFLLDRIYRRRHGKHKDKKYKLPRWFNRPRLNLIFYRNNSAYHRERRDRVTTPFTKGDLEGCNSAFSA